MANTNTKAINIIKGLSLDMIENAGSGHPGIVLGATPIIYALYLEHLNVVPSKPNWMNRDRFILSCGHGSAMYYAMLHMAGFDISIDDLKRFRDIDSFTPGHPELDPAIGIDATTGALGQGIANAVGIALGERYLENICKSYDKKCNLVDFYTYVLCSDGDLQEGISYEALSFAGTQKLNKLIVLYDDNKIQLDGEVSKTFTEDIETRFESINFNVIDVKNGSSVTAISDAIDEAKESKKPSIIICHTKIGKDSSLEGTNAVHGKPLDLNEVEAIKKKLELPLEPFVYNDEVKQHVINSINKRIEKKYSNWQKTYDKCLESRNKDVVNIINLLERNEFEIDFDSDNYKINDNYYDEGRNSNNKAMNFVAGKTKFFLGGSADLSSSTKAMINSSGILNDITPCDRNIYFGVREHAMGGILNGLALLNLRVFGSTYLTFADYLKPSLRMSAIMNLPVTYIFTHDSVSIGQDGATHEPIEQLTMLRSTPNLVTIRPADIKETIGAWEYIVKNNGPVALVLSKSPNHILKHTRGKYVKYGAYIVKKESERLDLILIATGSEVEKALNLADDLQKEGLDVRVVSMPSMELFLKQKSTYEDQLLPKNVLTITIEAGSTLMWHRFATNRDCALGIDSFGASGKPDDVLKFVGFDYNSLLIKIKQIVDNH